jgi:hypothetical protein
MLCQSPLFNRKNYRIDRDALIELAVCGGARQSGEITRRV